ncbi:MAG: helix-turn-helix domain-containing protein [Betaproteobacteria bacterium]|nr:helix-turn-helix domain-containing protein [Betaproteobacteria bacterium]
MTGPGNSESIASSATAAAEEMSPASNDPVSPATAPEPPTPGAFLRAARERAGLSVADLASRLRMGGRQIDALERADYAQLPKGTFLRGFVRNYARAVNADGAEAIALLEHSNADAKVMKTPSIVVPSQNIKLVPAGGELASPRGRIAIALGVAACVGFAFWYWWQFVRPTVGAAESPAPANTEQALQIPAATPATNEALSPAPAAEQAAVPATPVAPARSEPAPSPKVAIETKPAAPVRAKGSGVLGFTFTGDSWVEVVDADSKRLISRRFHAGEADEASGRTPLSVVIGNAQVTRMAFNGQEFDLAPHTRVSVARVTVK